MKRDMRKHLFISSHESPETPELDGKDYIIDQTTSNFWHLEHTDTPFCNHCTYLALVSKYQSDFSSKSST